jgi:hypothetical protein
MLNKPVDSLLAANGQLHKDCLVMDQAPSGKMAFFVFDALLMREEITCLGFAITFHDASCLPPLLSRLNDRLLEMIALGGMSLSGSQANEIVKEMLNIDVHRISFFLKKDYCLVVFCTFQHSLQESSVRYSSFYCEPGDWISTEALQSICTGIICLLVRVLVLSGLKV